MKNGANSGMRRGAARLARPQACDAERVTLLELVEAVGETTEDDAEVVATVMHLLRSGAVMLQGNFQGEPAGQFRD